MDPTKENRFQENLVASLEAGGWLVGRAADYDRGHALYPADLLDYVRETQPEAWGKFCRMHPVQPEAALVKKVVRTLEKEGTLDALRHGFKTAGVGALSLCGFQPDHGMNPETERRYRANRLRVVAELSYSPHARPDYPGGCYDPRLDLALFVNGIPVATLELKSEFKQSLELAIRQYRQDRPPAAPHNRKAEPLLSFKRGALVHFAVTQREVAMCTRLEGGESVFLPFNQGGEGGGAGNPEPADKDRYATAYLWENILQPDNWLRILGRFLHLEKKDVTDFHGRRKRRETLIFPRYHQWDVVTRLVRATAAEGAGRRYLVQHSAGSGKSNSIAWAAYQLAQLYDKEGGKLFSSVIVVTDRTVLDNQLQDTIHQFEHASGVVRGVRGRGEGASKSEQLAKALHSKARIIIVTLQTFPALYEALAKRPRLAEGRYAVIADEAHSSQAGASAGKLKAILGGAEGAPEGLDIEDLLARKIAERTPCGGISYYAFTATPKAKTLELFGRPPRPELPPGGDNLPAPFHVYSMRQAIEEGFILDVLRNYTTYGTAWKLAHPKAGREEVDSEKARRTLARWVRLHPHNIESKVEVVVEHFRANVRHLLDGRAKAMLVTASRREAVRHHLAMQAYIRRKGYRDVFPLVAFSGSVPADEHIPQEVTETSALLNPGLDSRDHARAFDTRDYNVMIAANKFQTGFDQPKLCAMYVDKPLAGVDCVQTLSRLNRLHPGKRTFILDFVNDDREVLAAFQVYYQTARLSGVSDPDVVYEIQAELDREKIHLWDEVRRFVEVFLQSADPATDQQKLLHAISPAVERFRQRNRALAADAAAAKAARAAARRQQDPAGEANADKAIKEAGQGLDALKIFRKNLQRFTRAYEFLSQIISYDDPDLEQLAIFARYLHPLLRPAAIDEEEIDLDGLSLSAYRLTARRQQQLRLKEDESEPIAPLGDTGGAVPRDPKTELLAEIIRRLNEIFGADIPEEHNLDCFRRIEEHVKADALTLAQIQNNDEDQAMYGRLRGVVSDLLVEVLHESKDRSESFERIATTTLGDERKLDELSRLLYRSIRGSAERGAAASAEC